MQFGGSSGQIPPVQIDSSTSEYVLSYPGPVVGTYGFEATRLSGLQCSYCGYGQSPPDVLPDPFEFLGPAGIRSVNYALPGPCFDGRASSENMISCVQNLLLFPPSYCGTYFFPNQILNPYMQKIGVWEPHNYHGWVEGSYSSQDITQLDAFGNQLDPSAYGLGRASAEGYLSQMQIVSRATPTLANQTASAALQAPYQPFPNGTSRFVKFAQHFCRYTCHRDSLFFWTYPTAKDLNDTRHLLMNRIDPSTNLQQAIIRCAPCPPYYRAYQWGRSLPDGTYAYDRPEDPRLLIVSFDCWPHFGALPQLALPVSPTATALVFWNFSVTQHGQATDGVSFPTSTANVRSIPCAVNTYNDRCAHYYVYAGQGPPTACTPCPPGFHTAGQVGAWHCLPPAGQTIALAPGSSSVSPRRNAMTLFRDARTNISTIWARRDLLGYEWECGTQPTHCWQCSQYGLPAATTPDGFNQAMILQPLLQWQACPVGFYCPAAIDSPPIACPASLPWSPPGSSTLANCTCAPRTYRAGPNNCTACPTPAAMCGTGQFLSGYTQCIAFGGATSGGTCMPCTNKPPNAAYLPGAGLEAVVVSGGGGYVGVCPFECPRATQLSGASGGCTAALACVGVPKISFNGGQPFVFSAALQNLTDQFLTTTPACPFNALLSQRLALAAVTRSSVADVSATCAAATPTLCASTATNCYVVQDATFYSDYVCAPCPPPPNNSAIVPQPLAMTCNVQCQPGFFFNATSNACASCAALNARVCPQGSYLRGGGCYGNFDPLPTLTDLAYLTTHSCVVCNIDLAAANLVQGQTFLNLFPSDGGRCRVMTCASGNGVSTYTATPCSGTTDSVVRTCVSACPAGTWLQGVCSLTTSPVCIACTTFKRGSYNVSACGVRSDAVWALCGVDAAANAFTQPGLFCPGDGSAQPCPFNQTSQAGAASVTDCFCPVGTVLADDGLSCQPTLCPDAVADISAPGAGWTSASYMSLGGGFKTVCTPCGAASFSVGDGVGQASCVCPVGMYLSGGSCAACPSTLPTCVGGGYYTGVSDTCWTGRTRSAGTCECLQPPYIVAQTSSSCDAATTCALGFDIVPGLNGGGHPASAPAGGAMYVPTVHTQPRAWDVLYQHNPALHEDSHLDDFVIGDVVCTSDLYASSDGVHYDGWGSLDNYQYAVWILRQVGTYQVYAVPLPNQRAPTYDPYLNGDVWSVLPYGYQDTSTLLRVAVAQWPTAQTPGRYIGDPAHGVAGFSVGTEVGVVARDDATGGLYLYHNTLSVDLADSARLGAPLWGAATSLGVNLTSPRGSADDTDCVALAHAYAVPGGSSSSASVAGLSTFYAALSSVGSGTGVVVAVNSWNNNQRVLVLAGLPPLSSMTLLTRPDGLGVNLYLLLPASATVQLVEWTSAAIMTRAPTPLSKSELFFASSLMGRNKRLLPVLWPSTSLNPTFLALVEEPLHGVDTGEPVRYATQPRRYSVYVADAIQRTFTPVHDMPPLTRASAVGAVGTGVNAAMLVAASGSNLFSINTRVCAARAVAAVGVAPTYWDGAQCQTHVCVRASACDTVHGQVWDSRTLRCVCAPGYWTYVAATASTDLLCRICSSSSSTRGTYCPGNGTSVLCPFPGMTSPDGATAATDCICAAGFFFDAVAKRCATCATGTWCPNQWSALPCPGAADTAASIGGLSFPTACLCRSGYTDVRCGACPPSSVCPSSTLFQVTNNAFALTLAAAVGQSDPCPDLLWPKLATYLSATRISYLSQADQLVGRLACTFVPAPTDRTGVAPLAVIVVQTETADASNALISSMPANIVAQFFASSSIVLGSTSTLAAALLVYNNTPTACAAGKAPTVPDAITCVCAQGFASSSSSGCTQCGAGQFKAALGPGACAPCPVGTTSPLGASACVTGRNGNSNSTGAGGGTSTTLIIAGSVGGGVVAVGLLVWLFVSVCAEG